MDRIVLDDKSFKALSAKSRVGILKKLTERRMTLSELSNKLSLKNSTVKEHCDLLLDAQLVNKIDDGRKWKYYELTNKGRQIATPSQFQDPKVLVMISFAAIIFASIILFSMQGTITGSSFSTSNTMLSSEKLMIDEVGIATTNIPLDDPTRENITIDQNITLNGVDYNLFSITVIFTLVIGIFAGWSVGKRN